MADFVKADIQKLESFITDSADVIKEFAAIRTEFERINRVLLGNWAGTGREAYKEVTDHILEKIGGVESVLKTINEQVVKAIVDHYNAIDKELGEYNRTAGKPKEGET